MIMTEPYYITESKRICEASGMDPNEVSRPKTFLSEQEFEEKRKSYSEILSVVSFFSNKLLDSLKGTPILVVVSDADGYLLEIEGDETSSLRLNNLGLNIVAFLPKKIPERM